MSEEIAQKPKPVFILLQATNVEFGMERFCIGVENSLEERGGILIVLDTYVSGLNRKEDVLLRRNANNFISTVKDDQKL